MTVTNAAVKIPAADAVNQVLADIRGLPVFLTGSAPAAMVYDNQFAYTDVDLFVPNEGMYFATVTQLLNKGYSLESDRYEKMWRRHCNHGFKNWHTNSMKLLDDLTGTEVNVVYKKVDGHETTQLSQVLESFDFGLLAVGFDVELGTFHDMRSYFFGLGADDGRALPMLPYRNRAISQGLMSQHVMLRTPGRYHRYACTYGYDLSKVKPTLVEGYWEYARYKAKRSKPEDLTLGRIAAALAASIETDKFDELHHFEKQLPMSDGLDEIMASLE